jgi:glucosamine--fructose-6-phosphate aminotransferase (isomerizing)
MCGIIGATGGEVLTVLLDGLARLEYRGYDSAGVVLQAGGELWRARAAHGTRSLDELRRVTDGAPAPALSGIGHTRWATHGRPTEHNAHPHVDCSGRVAVVHNGIIENWRELAAKLEAGGHTFTSQTDTEVIAHLVEEELSAGVSLADAVRATLRTVRGAFAIAMVFAGEPGTIVAARRVSPLVVGLADERDAGPGGRRPEAYVASDIPALIGRTRRLWAIEDDQVVELRAGTMRVTTLAGKAVEPAPLVVEWDLEAAEKGGFDDFMSKEIHEQPRALSDTLLGRLLPDGAFGLDEMRIGPEELRDIRRVSIVACGSSYHAALVAKYAVEHWARLPTEVDIASEFRYRDPVLDERTLVIGVSQSGETIDTLQALREARQWGARVLVISNVVDSSMAREADGVLYTRAGPEVGVAATKTHLAQLAALEVLALYLAQLRGALSPADSRLLFADLLALPGLVEQVLGRQDAVADIAARFASTRDFFFLGRHVGFPVALEGALKLKEISYRRAEGYPAGELKHGPIALIEPGTVVVGVATRTPLWEKMMSNVAEVKSRGATVVLVANDGHAEAQSQADEVLWVPETHPLFAPIVDVVPLQLFAYHVARAHGLDVDRPRNLAKTVTVE